MKLKTYLALSSVFTLLLPMGVFAQVAGAPTVGTWVMQLAGWLTVIPKLLVAIAVILILYNAVSYMWKKRDGASGEDIKKQMASLMSSITMLVIALSIWGIMAILVNTLGVPVISEPPPIPGSGLENILQ